MTIAVSGRRDFREVTEIARKQIKEARDGPRRRAVILVGGQDRAMNVIVDPDRLAAHDLSVDEVRAGASRARTSRCPAAGSTRAAAS